MVSVFAHTRRTAAKAVAPAPVSRNSLGQVLPRARFRLTEIPRQRVVHRRRRDGGMPDRNADLV